MKRVILLLFVITNLGTLLAFGSSDKLQISNAWARRSIPPNKNSAAYMNIANITDQQVILISASAESISNNVELHESFVNEDGISKMNSIDNLVIPARSSIELKPGSTHIMLLNLLRPLNIGEKFLLVLKSSDGDLFSIETSVK